jgi:3-deoxy-7-phosphoheptulonate synthase
MYKNGGHKNPAIIVDANHANSQKRFYEQPRIVKEIMHSRSYNPDIANIVKGVMIESYIEEGNQKIGTDNHVYGKSITDACLGFEETKELLLYMAEKL